MQITRTITINAPESEVWSLVGPGFAAADRWASSINRSSARECERKCEASPIAGRGCDTSVGPVEETVLEYDDNHRRLSYEARAEGMPGFVRRLVNTWQLHGSQDGLTIVEMRLQVDIDFPFNILMGPLMKLKLGGILQQALNDLKHFAETSTPSPAKVRAISTYQKNAAKSAA